MYKPKLIIMIGCPGSGKSTIAKEMIEPDEDNTESWAYVSRDEVRYEMVAEEDGYFSKENDVYREFIARIKYNLERGNHVIADATHTTVASRKKLLSKIPRDLYDHCEAWIVETPLEICLSRNAQRVGRTRVPDEVVKKMFFATQKPTKREGIDILTHFYKNGIKTEVL